MRHSWAVLTFPWNDGSLPRGDLMVPRSTLGLGRRDQRWEGRIDRWLRGLSSLPKGDDPCWGRDQGWRWRLSVRLGSLIVSCWSGILSGPREIFPRSEEHPFSHTPTCNLTNPNSSDPSLKLLAQTRSSSPPSEQPRNHMDHSSGKNGDLNQQLLHPFTRSIDQDDGPVKT